MRGICGKSKAANGRASEWRGWVTELAEARPRGAVGTVRPSEKHRIPNRAQKSEMAFHRY